MECPAGFSFTPLKGGPLAAVTEHLTAGQRFLFWDYDITWSDNHMRASELEPYRMMGDPLADNALEALGIKHGQDAYEALVAYTSRPIEEQADDAPRKFMESVTTVPSWVDWSKIQQGQAVHCALLHFSLAGGFNLPKISKVLTSTGYLAGDKTKYRVLETAQFVVDVMQTPDSLKPETGAAWKSIIQVRFLHAQVRQKLSRLSKAHSKYYNVQEYGVPINQEDMSGTLYSFSAVVWKVMEERMGVAMTRQEQEDYLHVWRYIGYIMGVDPVFDPASSVDRANAILESIILHLTDPSHSGGQLCAGLLHSMHGSSSSLLRPDPYKLHMAMAEFLLGPQVWSLMGHAPTSLYYRVLKRLILRLLHLDLWSVSKMPRWWFRARFSIILWLQNRAIRAELGSKRTNFALSKEPKVLPHDLAGLSPGPGSPPVGHLSKTESSASATKASWQSRALLTTFSVAVLVIAARNRKHQRTVALLPRLPKMLDHTLMRFVSPFLLS
ncbi:hypothetical protein DFQ27_006556 [Actinomortierella ambigua]|uniref:ER-bound oxygenase mpaB/mpaB'/Rubber oxygenase catalytic domain-containing protein n=1 Tax=Actinomortierella ambigua TaxID=1343610 RepID=A0A9P6QH48_9FUNG|nr:hypothetical protein DFQ27_006556 [Actinomortierella ambigua]